MFDEVLLSLKLSFLVRVERHIGNLEGLAPPRLATHPDSRPHGDINTLRGISQ